MNPADTQRHRSSAGPLPMPHCSSKPRKAADIPLCCRSPTVLQFSSHPKSCIPCSTVLSLQQCLLCDSRFLSSLPSISAATCCSYGAQMLSSISAPPVHFTSSCRSYQTKLFICWALPTASAPGPFWGACFDNCLLHNKVVIRIFETMEPVVNGSLDNSREIRFHVLRFSVTPCILHTHRSTAQSMHCCALGWSLQNCFPAYAQ